jgi:hypothetical protein
MCSDVLQQFRQFGKEKEPERRENGLSIVLLGRV